MAARHACWAQAMSEPQRIVRFHGGVSCRRDGAPLGLTLIGGTTERPDEIATLAFSGAAPEKLPEALEDATVEKLSEGQYRIRSGRREWVFPARAAYLHREVSAVFYRAIAPRVAPWSKRLFWRLVLSLAANPAGRRLLLSLRGR
jgi:hypothetical protein